MPIDLSDIPASVAEYLDTHVTTTVTDISSGGTVEAGGNVSVRYGITATRVSQLRREFHQDWEWFCGIEKGSTAMTI
jgi:hypothetical protein